MIIKNGNYGEYYCDKCGVYLNDKDSYIKFRNLYFDDIDCFEKYLLKNSITYEDYIEFDEEEYKTFQHLYVECYDELIFV